MADDMDILGASEVKQRNEMFETLNKLFDGKNKNLDMITQLTKQEVFHLARIEAFYHWSDRRVAIIPAFVIKFMRLRLSEERKSRKEAFDALKPNLMYPMGGEPSSWQKLTGR